MLVGIMIMQPHELEFLKCLQARSQTFLKGGSKIKGGAKCHRKRF